MNNETLKRDLCARLPYRVKILRPDNKTILELKGILGGLLLFQEDGVPFETFGSIKSGTNLPILFPTSALTKPIQIANYNNGEPFVPIVELLSVMYFKDAYRFNKAYIDGNNHILSGFWDSSNEHEFKFIFNDEVQSFSLFDKTHKRVNGVLSMFDLLNQWHINYRLSPDQFIEVTEEFNPYL